MGHLDHLTQMEPAMLVTTVNMELIQPLQYLGLVIKVLVEYVQQVTTVLEDLLSHFPVQLGNTVVLLVC